MKDKIEFQLEEFELGGIDVFELIKRIKEIIEVKDYANQRVIEELEEIKIRLSKKSFSEHCVEEVDNRIKELKH